jgi:hypothetical protein
VQGVSSRGVHLEDCAPSGGQGGGAYAELFPHVGFIVTNLTVPSRAMVPFYKNQGIVEQWITECKQVVKITSPSRHPGVADWLSVGPEIDDGNHG